MGNQMVGKHMIDTARHSAPARLGAVVAAARREIGDAFSSLHFAEDQLGREMGGLMMVDHFVMTAPTFAPHLHVGMAVVTALFDDAHGELLNRDTLGRNIALKPGDLYWLTAAVGAVHEQRPGEGARAHGLQIFLDLPACFKSMPSHALHVRADEAPLLAAAGYRVRVLLGVSGDVAGAQGSPQEMTLLDGALQAGGRFVHQLPPGRHAWIYVVSGALTVGAQGEQRMVPAGHAISVGAGAAAGIGIEAVAAAHFVLLATVATAAAHPVRIDHQPAAPAPGMP